MIRVTVWGENKHEHTNEKVRKVYPRGMHTCIAEFLNTDPELKAVTATLDQPEHGGVIGLALHPEWFAFLADDDGVVAPLERAVRLRRAQHQRSGVALGPLQDVASRREVKRGVARLAAEEEARRGRVRVKQLERGLHHLRGEIRGGSGGGAKGGA